MALLPRITIIGAGLAGLSCAYYLEQAGFKPLLYERDKRVGGRIQTDRLQGFLLDRGFQVVLSNYPEFKTLFSPQQLQLKEIPSGANIYWNNRWIQVDNPLKRPNIFQWKDLSFMQLSDIKALAKGLWLAYRSVPTTSTETFLRECGVSNAFINAFWRPFFGGVFLELPLKTQAQTFIKLASYFATGFACLPQDGMQAIPLQLAQRLKQTTVFTSQSIQSIENRRLILSSGEEITTDVTVLAMSGLQASHLVSTLPTLSYQSVTCLYFAVHPNAYPFSPYIHLNGTGEGPINNLLFNHLIQSSYAPTGEGLVSVSIVNPEWQTHENLLALVIEQLSQWFGLAISEWRHLKTYRIMQALPDQTGPRPFPHSYLFDESRSLYLCGELVNEPSINGALYSGRQMAQHLAALF